MHPAPLMTRPLCLIGIAALLAGCGQGEERAEAPVPAATAWGKVDDTGGGFVVAMPGEPRRLDEAEDRLDGAVGPRRALVAEDDGTVLSVRTFDLGGPPDDPGAVLDAVGHAWSAGPEPPEGRDLVLDGLPGREWSGRFRMPGDDEAEAEAVGRLRAVVAGRRVYVLGALGEGDIEDDADRFLASFRVTADLGALSEPIAPPPTAAEPTALVAAEPAGSPEPAEAAPAEAIAAAEPEPAEPEPAPTAWVAFEPAGGGFEAVLPGEPTVQDEGGRLVATAESDGVLYRVERIRLGDDAAGDPAGLLDRLREADLGARGGLVVREEPIDLGGHPGRDRVDQQRRPDGALVAEARSRTVLDGETAYVALCYRPAEAGSSADVDRFFDAFRPDLSTAAPAPAVAAVPEPAPEPPPIDLGAAVASEVAPWPPEAPALRPIEARDLSYDWKAGRSRAFAVEAVADTGGGIERMVGSVLYEVVAVDDGTASIVATADVTVSWPPADGSEPKGHWYDRPGSPVRVALTVDRDGRVVGSERISGEPIVLPGFGPLERVPLVPLPEGSAASWEGLAVAAIDAVQVTKGGDKGLGIGPKAPWRLAPAPAGEPETRLFSQQPSPAEDDARYRLAAGDDGAVELAIDRSIRADGPGPRGRREAIAQRGRVAFDPAAGAVRSVWMAAVVALDEGEEVRRVPLRLTCRAVEGRERDRALARIEWPPLWLRPASDAEIDAALDDLRADDDNRVAKAADRLRTWEPRPDRRDAVARALEAKLDGTPWIRGGLARALGVWGDERSIPPLIALSRRDQPEGRGESYEALGRIGPDPRSVDLLVPRLETDDWGVRLAVIAMGPLAEPALLDRIRDDGTPEAFRIRALEVLRQLGGRRSLPALEAIAAERPALDRARVAVEAIEAIARRHPSDAQADSWVDDLRSVDRGRVYRALEAMARARPDDRLRDRLSRAVEPSLDDREDRYATAACNALAVWADGRAIDALAAHVRDAGFRPWRDAARALVARSAGRGQLEAIVDRFRDDNGQVIAILKPAAAAVEPLLLERCRGDGPIEERVDACRLLGDLGTPGSLDQLRRLREVLEDEPLIREALQTIGRVRDRYPDAAAQEQWLADLALDPNRRTRALDALARARASDERRGPIARAVEQVLERDDRDRVVRACKALAVWGDDHSADLLARRAADRKFEPWRDALKALVELRPDEATARIIVDRWSEDVGLGRQLLAAIDEAAVPALAALVADDNADQGRRVEAARMLGQLQAERALDALRAATDESEPGGLVQASKAAVAQIQGRRITAAEFSELRDAARSDDVGKVRGALNRLATAMPDDGKRGEVLAAATAKLDHPDGGVADLAWRTLRAWGDDATRSALIDRLRRPDDPRWRDAAATLAALNPSRDAAVALARRLPDDEGRVRGLLGELGPEAAEPALLELIEAKDAPPPLRLACCRALVDLGTPACLPALRAIAARQPLIDLAHQAEGSERTINNRIPDDPTTAALLDDLNSGDPKRITPAVHRLAAVERPAHRRGEVADALERQLGSEVNDLPRHACRALAVWGDGGGADALAARVRDPAFPDWRDAATALVALSAARPHLEAVAARAAEDPGLVDRLFAGLPTGSEPVLLAILGDAGQPTPARAAAVRALRTIGTPAALGPLHEAARVLERERLVSAAEGTLHAIDGA